MKFKYVGQFPMWVEVDGKSKLVEPKDIVETSHQLGEGFESLEQVEKKPRKKRRAVDASSTETSSVW